MSNQLPVSLGGRQGASPDADRTGRRLGRLGAEAEALLARHADREDAALDLVLRRLERTDGRLREDELESLVHLLEGHGRRARPREPHCAEGRPDRARFFTDVRRFWMHSAARQRPNAILIIGARHADADAAASLERQRRAARVREALSRVFGRLTQVYAWDRDTIAMVLPGLNLRQAVAIAETTRRAVAQESARGSAGNIVVHAGVAALHREDDPSAAINLAQRCLEIAGEGAVSKVVCETDPEARFAFGSRLQDRPRASRVA